MCTQSIHDRNFNFPCITLLVLSLHMYTLHQNINQPSAGPGGMGLADKKYKSFIIQNWNENKKDNIGNVVNMQKKVNSCDIYKCRRRARHVQIYFQLPVSRQLKKLNVPSFLGSRLFPAIRTVCSQLLELFVPSYQNCFFPAIITVCSQLL